MLPLLKHPKLAHIVITATSFLSTLAAGDTTSADLTCYRRDGTEWTAELSNRLGTSQVFPCNPAAPVTQCCRAEDYCLSNGLCIDAQNDNWYTIQGCTTQVWEGPCVNNFQNDNGSEEIVIHVWACDFQETKDVIYCLGESNCCSNNGAATVLLPRWTDVYRPGASLTSSSSTGATTTAATGDTKASTDTSATSSQTTDQTALKIALGVGVGVGACLIASILFLGLQIRKKNASNEKLERAMASIVDGTTVLRPPTYCPPVELETPPAELHGSLSPTAPSSKSAKDSVSHIKLLFSPLSKKC